MQQDRDTKFSTADADQTGSRSGNGPEYKAKRSISERRRRVFGLVSGVVHVGHLLAGLQ
jgi:hypothetical protein